MITAGVDLASQPVGTAACGITWTERSAEVTHLEPSGVDDEAVLALMGGADKSGLDVPLGWPQAFVDAVAEHQELRPWTGGSLHELRFRVTDRHVAAVTGRWLLSVSSDLIALPAMRAAALRRWGFIGQGYKRRAGAENRGLLVSLFRKRTEGWLQMSDERWYMCERNDDAFDAMIATLVARAAYLGRCDDFAQSERDVVSREGWIALPAADSLDRLGDR